ncbi:MAG: TIGR02099 family protein [Gammaproteobacteria bacterium]|nr:TIGR02099 family protein [Gammaproteobacteria bacterium]MCI0591514.1 TIGR02099 family protein [Gammaproteobacteria bacterium]
MFKRVIKFLFGVAWYAFAGITLFAAIAVTVVRLMLPGISEYREEIQQWVSRYMEQPVEIESINANWQGWRPQLDLQQISLLEKNGTGHIARFQRAHISIDPISSLLRKELVPGSLTISGLQLSLMHNPDGSITVKGFDEADVSKRTAGSSGLGAWLQRQQQLTIEQARVTWVDLQTMKEPLAFSNVSLQLRSAGKRLQLEGSAQLPRYMGNRLDFALDADGDLLTPEWSGELYVEGHGIHPGPWLRDIARIGVDMAHGEMDLKVWTTWSDGTLTRIDGQFATGPFDLLIDGAGMSLTEAKAELTALRTASRGWRIDVNRLWVTTPEGPWPDDEIHLQTTPMPWAGGYHLTGSIRFLKLGDIAPLLANSSGLSATIRHYLTKSAPRGELHNVQFDYRPDRLFDERLFLKMSFNDLIAGPDAGVPGISGLRGSISGTLGTGVLLLDRDPVEIQFPTWFEMPFWLNWLEGAISWTHDDDGWTLTSDTLAMRNNDMSAKLRGRLAWSGANPAPTADLVVTIEDGRLEHISRYLPKTVPDADKDWVKGAVLAGRITEGVGVWRGALNEFPFSQGQGRFQVRATIRDGVLDYATGWPQLSAIEAAIAIEGWNLTVDVTHAMVLNSEIVSAHGGIADVSAPDKVFKGQSTIKAAAADVRRFILESPLASQAIGRQVTSMDFDGTITIDLAMETPLMDEGSYAVQGQVQLAGNAVHSNRLGATFTDIEGQLEFTETRLDAKGLEGKLFDRPVHFDISTDYVEENASSELLVSGTADPAFLADQLRRFDPTLALLDERWIDGDTKWQAEITLPTDCCNAQTPGQVRLTSQLEGMTVHLPAPLGKATDEETDLTILTQIGDSTQNRFTFRYGANLSGVLELHPEPVAAAMNRIGLHLGPGTPRLPDRPGLAIDGQLPELAVSPWLDLLQANERNRGASMPYPPEAVNVDVAIARLEVLDQWLNSAKLKIAHDERGWIASIVAAEASGSITVPAAGLAAPVHAEFEKLTLATVTPPDATTRTDPRRLPALTVHCKALTYGSVELGETRLRATPVSDGLRLDELAFISPGLNILGQGDWLVVDEVQRSHVDITVEADDLGKLLNRFGYNVTSIEGGAAQLDIDASWQGAPRDFSLATMNGTLHMNVGKGRFLDIQQGVGRIFGLLSFQTLARRLSLDFDDMYQKGFPFDRIEGTFDFENGNAYTNDFVMEGPSARMGVTGRTGLIAQDYNQTVTVTPAFASSLPVASALFGPVGVGVGAAILVVGQMFKSLPDQLDNVLSHQYIITGSWDNPTVERVNAKNHEAASAPSRFIDGVNQ